MNSIDCLFVIVKWPNCDTMWNTKRNYVGDGGGLLRLKI